MRPSSSFSLVQNLGPWLGVTKITHKHSQWHGDSRLHQTGSINHHNFARIRSKGQTQRGGHISRILRNLFLGGGQGGGVNKIFKIQSRGSVRKPGFPEKCRPVWGPRPSCPHCPVRGIMTAMPYMWKWSWGLEGCHGCCYRLSSLGRQSANGYCTLDNSLNDLHWAGEKLTLKCWRLETAQPGLRGECCPMPSTNGAQTLHLVFPGLILPPCVISLQASMLHDCWNQLDPSQGQSENGTRTSMKAKILRPIMN